MEDRDSILIEFEEAGADLAQWVRRYPDHASDLMRRAMQMRLPVAACPQPDTALLSVARDTLAAARAARQTPLASLKNAARERGLDPETVAAGLGLPVEYFWKLHRRLFRPETVPAGLLSALAQMLGRTSADIAAYLQRPPSLAAGASYRADSAPRVGERESFAEALLGDPDLTEAQRRRWRDTDGRGDSDGR